MAQAHHHLRDFVTELIGDAARTAGVRTDVPATELAAMPTAPARQRAGVDAVTAAEPPGTRRAVRWFLLFCTLFGLATMHTLGHAGVHWDTHEHSVTTAVAMPVMATGTTDLPGAADVASAATDGHCPDGHCGGQPGHGGTSGWAICVAVLGGLAVAVLLVALLLLPATGLLASIRERLPALRGPRPPPRRRLGLIVASTAVLRI